MSVAGELAARGHEVAWTAPHALLPRGATVVGGCSAGVDAVDDVAGLVAALAARPPETRAGPVEALVLWDDVLLPLAERMLPAVQAAVDEFDPDALVVDQQALAGAAVAEGAGLPWATLVPTPAGLVDPVADVPEVARRIRRGTRRFLRRAGLDEVTAARIDPRRSPALVVAFSTERFSGPVEAPAGRHAFVGPWSASATGPGPDREGAPSAPFDWARLDPARRLVVVAPDVPQWRRGARPLGPAADVFWSLGVQAVLVAPQERTAGHPDDVVVVPRAPLGALARRASVVVCAGAGPAVCDLLVRGVPLVVVPSSPGQAAVAGQVVRAAAGLRVPAVRADAGSLGRAVAAVLGDARLREGARQVGDSFAGAGGAPVAADRLEALVGVAPGSGAVLR
ncbi:MAG TPA: nucleotide disphospho-sugar-binding domain-containing protein [Acidimicrobiales bacterium]|nr:nucleotide disphospho-sugar-binding domain-containing protein [Acidimicrobiales bacterium]